MILLLDLWHVSSALHEQQRQQQKLCCFNLERLLYLKYTFTMKVTVRKFILKLKQNVEEQMKKGYKLPKSDMRVPNFRTYLVYLYS